MACSCTFTYLSFDLSIFGGVYVLFTTNLQGPNFKINTYLLYLYVRVRAFQILLKILPSKYFDVASMLGLVFYPVMHLVNTSTINCLLRRWYYPVTKLWLSKRLRFELLIFDLLTFQGYSTPMSKNAWLFYVQLTIKWKYSYNIYMNVENGMQWSLTLKCYLVLEMVYIKSCTYANSDDNHAQLPHNL